MSFKESDELIRIACEIFVGHDSQKGILIGHKVRCCEYWQDPLDRVCLPSWRAEQLCFYAPPSPRAELFGPPAQGAALKAVGTRARKQLEIFFAKQVRLHRFACVRRSRSCEAR